MSYACKRPLRLFYCCSGSGVRPGACDVRPPSPPAAVPGVHPPHTYAQEQAQCHQACLSTPPGQPGAQLSRDRLQAGLWLPTPVCTGGALLLVQL
eukprot:349262-Pelagomonas_calceolata.AAC.6